MRFGWPTLVCVRGEKERVAALGRCKEGDKSGTRLILAGMAITHELYEESVQQQQSSG